MPRLARIVIPGLPHHVTQRGNNRQDTFFVDDDRRVYLSILAEQADRFGLVIEGFCLMTNHMHLIATPQRPNSLAKALGRAHWRYTRYVNRLHGRSGHLWQNRFFSCALDDAHYWTAQCYVELNPVRAGMAREAWGYEWSSAAAHVSAADGGPAIAIPKGPAIVVPGAAADGGPAIAVPGAPAWLDMTRWRQAVGNASWKDSLSEGVSKADLTALRRNTGTGRPLGSDSWIAKLEITLGRRLRPLPGGRPRKVKKERKTR